MSLSRKLACWLAGMMAALVAAAGFQVAASPSAAAGTGCPLPAAGNGSRQVLYVPGTAESPRDWLSPFRTVTVPGGKVLVADMKSDQTLRGASMSWYVNKRGCFSAVLKVSYASAGLVRLTTPTITGAMIQVVIRVTADDLPTCTMPRPTSPRWVVYRHPGRQTSAGGTAIVTTARPMVTAVGATATRITWGTRAAQGVVTVRAFYVDGSGRCQAAAVNVKPGRTATLQVPVQGTRLRGVTVGLFQGADY